eukprot:241548-Rhodomonas_salina.2
MPLPGSSDSFLSLVSALRLTAWHQATVISVCCSATRYALPETDTMSAVNRMSDTFREERRSSSGAWEGRRDGVTRRLRDEFDGLQMSRTASNVTRPAGNAFRVETEVALRMQELDEEAGPSCCAVLRILRC